jgi:hypothetical protein
MIDLANINNQFDSKFETFSELVEKNEKKSCGLDSRSHIVHKKI